MRRWRVQLASRLPGAAVDRTAVGRSGSPHTTSQESVSLPAPCRRRRAGSVLRPQSCTQAAPAGHLLLAQAVVGLLRKQRRWAGWARARLCSLMPGKGGVLHSSWSAILNSPLELQGSAGGTTSPAHCALALTQQPSLPAVIPLGIAYTFLSRHIDWSGIRYWRARGRVVRVQH